MKISKKNILAVLTPIIIVGILIGRVELVNDKLFEPAKLSVFVFDVGQGDAIFIDGPEKQVLIDGGPDTSILEKLASVMLPWDSSIDLVIDTHPHADHIMGLVPVLERYRVAQVADSGQGYGTPEFHEYEKLAPDALHLKAGDTYDLGGGARLDFVWPNESYDGALLSDANDGSVVALLTYGDTTMLLTGDAGVAQEAAFLASSPFQGDKGGSGLNAGGRMGHIDVLKVGHHGSRTSTSEKLLQAITPDSAIISVGAGNSYGLPDEDSITRLEKFGATIYRTDELGSIRVTSTGGEPSITSFNF